ncbi:MAG: type II toxin-antitoxin system RelE/ParE family toxin [Alphaproteobacteria bacterium]
MEIEFDPAARKGLRGLPRKIAHNMIVRLEEIAADPKGLATRQHANVKDFGGGMYRVRVGDWRAMFQVQDDTLIVTNIGHRREIYR